MIGHVSTLLSYPSNIVVVSSMKTFVISSGLQLNGTSCPELSFSLHGVVVCPAVLRSISIASGTMQGDDTKDFRRYRISDLRLNGIKPIGIIKRKSPVTISMLDGTS